MPPTLVPLGPDIFVRRVRYRAMGLWIGRQLVVVRLGGGLWVHSPIPWSAALRAELASLGPVRHVVGPNRYHDECLQEFQSEYPEASFHGAPGLADLRRDIRFVEAPLSDASHADWSSVLDQHLVRGMPMLNEIVFYHRPSRSLILADLAFNFGPGDHWLLGVILKLGGTWGRFAPSRACRMMMKDRAAVRASIDRILSWDFDRILAGHGRNIDTGGKAVFQEAFAFLK